MRASFGGLRRSFFSWSLGRGVRPWPGAPRCWPRFAPRTGLLLLLALPAVERLRQDGPARAQLGQLLFQRLDPGPQGLDGLLLLAQPLHSCGQKRPFGKLGLQSLVLEGRRTQGNPQIGEAPRLHIDDVHLVVEASERPAQYLGLVGQPANRRLETLRPLQFASQPTVLPVLLTRLPCQGSDFPAQRLDRVPLLLRPFQRLAQPDALLRQRRLRGPLRFAPRRDLSAQRHDLALLPLRSLQGHAQPRVLSRQRPGRVLPGFRCQGLFQPRDLVAQRFDRAELARPAAGFGEQLLQARHFGLQGRQVLGRAAKVLGLLLGVAQPLPAGLEPRLPRTRIAAGGDFRPAQLFRARFRCIRPRPFHLRAGLPVARLARQRRHGGRPARLVPLGQRQRRPEILVAHRHARDDSESPAALPEAFAQRYDTQMKRAEPRKDIWLRPLRRDWKRTLNR